MDGLYLREPLTRDLSKYAMSEEMKDMIATFRQRIAIAHLSEDDYKKLEEDTAEYDNDS